MDIRKILMDNAVRDMPVEIDRELFESINSIITINKIKNAIKTGNWEDWMNDYLLEKI